MDEIDLRLGSSSSYYRGPELQFAADSALTGDVRGPIDALANRGKGPDIRGFKLQNVRPSTPVGSPDQIARRLERLQEIIKEADTEGITENKLSQLAGWSESALGNFKHGRRPYDAHLAQLENAWRNRKTTLPEDSKATMPSHDANEEAYAAMEESEQATFRRSWL